LYNLINKLLLTESTFIFLIERTLNATRMLIINNNIKINIINNYQPTCHSRGKYTNVLIFQHTLIWNKSLALGGHGSVRLHQPDAVITEIRWRDERLLNFHCRFGRETPALDRRSAGNKTADPPAQSLTWN